MSERFGGFGVEVIAGSWRNLDARQESLGARISTSLHHFEKYFYISLSIKLSHRVLLRRPRDEEILATKDRKIPCLKLSILSRRWLREELVRDPSCHCSFVTRMQVKY